MKICVFKEYAPNRLGRQPLTVRPRSTSTTTRRPSILRPSARLYAAENEVLTVNTIKSHRPFDHVLFFLTEFNLPSLLILSIDCFFFGFRKEEEIAEIETLINLQILTDFFKLIQNGMEM